MRVCFLSFILLLNYSFKVPVFAARIYEGKLEIIYIDSNDNPSKLFRLRLGDSSVKKLIVNENFDFEPGSYLKLSAKEENNNLKVIKVFPQKNKNRLIGTQDDANGNKKILVVMISDASFTENFIPYSQDEMQEMFFGSSFSLVDYIDEASSGKLKLTGQVISTIAIPNLCKSDKLFERDMDQVALQAVETKISDLDTYDFVTFVIPDRDECLLNSAGIGTLSRMGYNSKRGSISLGVNFVRSYNFEQYDYAFLNTAMHELGHNLGLNHANANSCGEAIFTAQACAAIEYGDGHSVMGTSPNMAHFNMLHKEDLGWVASSEVLTINNDSLNENITLLPVSSTQSGIKMIKVRRDDGRYYSVEYRQGTGYDGILERHFLNLNFGGFLVYLDEESIGNRPIMIDSFFEDYRTSSELVNSSGVSYYVNFEAADLMHDRGLFSASEVFNDTVSDIVISASSLGSNSATITVNKGSVDSEDDDINSSFSKVVFLDAKTLSQNITLDLNKKTKVFFNLPKDSSITNDSELYSVTSSVEYKKLIRVKKNKFSLQKGAFIPITLAPEKTFIKQGLNADLNRDYNISIEIKPASTSADSVPVTLTLKAKSSNFN
jgi:M6 family metalloprotease-like protein